MFYTTIKHFNKLLQISILEAKNYTVETCNAYLDKGSLIKCGRFCPIVFR